MALTEKLWPMAGCQSSRAVRGCHCPHSLQVEDDPEELLKGVATGYSLQNVVQP